MDPVSNLMWMSISSSTTSFSMRISKPLTLSQHFQLLIKPNGWTRTSHQLRPRNLTTSNLCHPNLQTWRWMDPEQRINTCTLQWMQIPFGSKCTTILSWRKESGINDHFKSLKGHPHPPSLLLKNLILLHSRSVGNHPRTSLKSEYILTLSPATFSNDEYKVLWAKLQEGPNAKLEPFIMWNLRNLHSKGISESCHLFCFCLTDDEARRWDTRVLPGKFWKGHQGWHSHLFVPRACSCHLVSLAQWRPNALMPAYTNGEAINFFDEILQAMFPHFLFYSADYPEQDLLPELQILLYPASYSLHSYYYDCLDSAITIWPWHNSQIYQQCLCHEEAYRSRLQGPSTGTKPSLSQGQLPMLYTSAQFRCLRAYCQIKRTGSFASFCLSWQLGMA